MNSEAEATPGDSSRPFVVGLVSSPHPHSEFHMKTLEVLQEVEAIHLCGLEGEDLEALAAESTKVRSCTGDLGELLKRPNLDSVLVCVRNDLCPEVLEAAIAAGTPVLFEKPGALRASDLERVADHAKGRGVTAGAFYQSRWSPATQEVRKALRDGALGQIMAVEARMVTSQVRYRDPSHWLFGHDTAGSGILSWLACHYIDQLCYLLDDRIVEVAAMTGRRNPEPIEVEDTACVALRFAGGVLGTLHAGYHLPGSRPGYVGAAFDTFLALRGTEGYARLSFSGGEYTLYSMAEGWAKGGQAGVAL